MMRELALSAASASLTVRVCGHSPVRVTWVLQVPSRATMPVPSTVASLSVTTTVRPTSPVPLKVTAG